MANTLTVNSPSGQYNIQIEHGLLKKIIENPAAYALDGHVIVATNTPLADLYGRDLAAALPNAGLIMMQDGEAYKNLDTVHHMYEQCIAAGADRHTTLLALGGGVVGDTMGFVAATYMRGIKLIQMPTSLLAMVDSSVGGKVGVDLPEGKNLVGAFKQPERVLIDPSVLKTLLPEEWRCGMGEIIKHGLLADEKLLDPALHNPDHAAELVQRAVQVKIDVVEEDPYEHGIRAHLNLGHTFAHAIERVTEYAWKHGDAVGAGLLAAAKLSHALGKVDSDFVERVDTILAETGLPRSLNGLNPVDLYEAMKTDKKWKNGVSHFVILDGMCQPGIVRNVLTETIIEVMESMQ